MARPLSHSILRARTPQAVFVGNGLMAILAGLVANFLVVDMKLGPVAPFDASAAVLLIGGAVIMFSWGENYGDPKSQHTLTHQFKMAAAAILGGELGVCICREGGVFCLAILARRVVHLEKCPCHRECIAGSGDRLVALEDHGRLGFYSCLLSASHLIHELTCSASQRGSAGGGH